MYLNKLLVYYLIFVLSDICCATIKLANLRNYSEFLNYGDEKLQKFKTDNRENDIIKSKVDVLGEIFKQIIDSIKVSEKLDIVFLIDASSSVGETNFRSELKFVKKLLSDVTVDLNHTRVAIVSFSSPDKVVKNIDGISVSRIENNKCLLLNQQLTSLNYTGGDTYTLGAFQEAKNIFDKGRQDSKKVLFLITDGFSNGGDPVPLAKELKDQQVTIFTIGIQNGNYRELYELASTPGEYHSYLLDSFQEFEKLARRALHVDLKSGEYIPLGINSPCDNLCDGGNCCDEKALCSCGTSTGHYSCVCPPGFYGSGFEGSCIACPIGTYSDGPNLCLPCPDANHITNPPALSIKDCKCRRGYTDTKDNQCEVVTCPTITKPEHSYLVKKKYCKNVLHSVCEIRCEVGYTLYGSSIRLCQDDGTWSGIPPTCQIKTCSKLTPPEFGEMTCSHHDLGIIYSLKETDLPIDTVCSFSCTNGHTLMGSHQRTCLPQARWDGLKATCKRVKCNNLPPVQYGQVEPESCKFGKQTYGKNCTIKCNEGFELVGPKVKSCIGSHGTWNPKFDVSYCKDITPPKITCPNNITINTEPGKKYGTTSWRDPDVTDNVHLAVSVWMTPAMINVPSHKFEIGKNKVTYFAQDAFHNRVHCSFYVVVRDEEPPKIENCMDPPTYLTPKKGGANITWDEPYIYDNSQYVTIERSHEFGSFPLGTTEVKYTVTDKSKNKNVCIIKITVEAAHCEALPDPIYGSSECSPNSNGIQCVITCEEGYAIPLAQPSDFSHPSGSSSVDFMCKDTESIWYNPEGLLFPECSVTTIPKETVEYGDIVIPMETDICSDEDKINEVENDIKSILHNSCIGSSCLVNTTSICEDEYEEDEEYSNIIKRQISLPEKKRKFRKKHKRLKMKFQIESRYDYGIPLAVNASKPQLDYHGQNLSLHYNKIDVTCPLGYVPRRNRCVQCPKGTYHNMTSNVCQSCTFGTYTNLVGQTECTKCPPHHSTRKVHSKSELKCRAECPPGTYARKKVMRQSKRHPATIVERTTLVPFCRSCPAGEYQPDYGKTGCQKCPDGYTTTTYGSTSISECVLTSKEICYMSQGVCYNGKCQPDNDYHYRCDCFDNYYGTFCEKKINECDSNPCRNGGTCTVLNERYKNDISCLCPKGFTGKFCETTEEFCPIDCSNNSTCLQDESDRFVCLCEPGFGGYQCETKIKYCLDSICENNSTCIEEQGSYKCLCSNGYVGKRCNILPCDYRPCKPFKTCINIMEPEATKNSYVCMCPDGLTGENCSEKVDYCRETPCQNGAECISEETGFSCKCSKLYYGLECQYKRDTKYILNFPRAMTTDYVKLNTMKNNVSEISVCLWLQTADQFNYGTLFSYSTKDFDNGFTITDYTGLVLYINNKYVVSDILLNDGYWHHLCLLWKGENGSYKFYVDGEEIKNGTNLSRGGVIQGGGSFIIGQEQDVMGGQFSQSEAFKGKLAYFDVWSRALTDTEVNKHFNDCEDLFFGDVYGWPEIQNYVDNKIQVIQSAFCNSCGKPRNILNGQVIVENGRAYYSCHKGYQVNSFIYSDGRKCTKASKWEGSDEPYCRRVYCGYPGYVRNGYSRGRGYFYGDRIIYRCIEGYEMYGSPAIACTENGTWYPLKPSCRGSQCTAFQIPERTNYLVMTDHSFEDFVEGKSKFDIGTQVEFWCKDEINDALVGEYIVTCQENGTWDFQPPKCVNKNLLTSTTSTTTTTTTSTSTTTTTARTIPISVTSSATTTTTTQIPYKSIVTEPVQPTPTVVTSVVLPKSQPKHIINSDCAINQIPPPPMNGYIDDDSLEAVKNGLSDHVYYKCRNGHRLNGINSTTCIVDGYWSEPKLSCDPVTCRRPRQMPNMIVKQQSVNHSMYFSGNMVQFECIEGYQFFGNNVIRCLANGRWTRMQGKCARKSCRKPLVSQKTIIIGDSYQYEDTVTIACPNSQKYKLKCNKEGKWEGNRDATC